MNSIALKSDAFFLKAIQALARSLAHLNPTPEDKVSSDWAWKVKLKKNIDLLSLKIKFSSNNYFDIVHKKAPLACSASTQDLMKLLSLSGCTSWKANTSLRAWSFRI